jgi:hypothetical protein
MPVAAWAGEKKGGEPACPVEILKKVDAACKAVKTVKYDVVFEATGPTPAKNAKVEASVILSGFAHGSPEKSLIDARVQRAESAEVRRITGGGDGEAFFVVDHQAKKAYEDIDPQVVGSFGRTLGSAVMIEFVHEKPFSDEINGKSQELRGSKEINGVDCYEIYVVYAAKAAPKATWYFGKKDFLPRGRIDEFTGPDGQKTVWKKMISNLLVEPKLDKEVFKLKLPEGYTKTDDFAP